MNTFQSEMRIAAHDAELKESKWDRASMVFLRGGENNSDA